MSELKKEAVKAYKEVEDKAEGFWNKHKYCIVGTGVVAVVFFLIGLSV